MIFTCILMFSDAYDINYKKMTSKEDSKKKLKLLCMHGFGTNKEFMTMQTEILRKDLESIAQFIFIDGPIEIPMALVNDPKVTNNIKGSAYSWFDFRVSHKTRTREQLLSLVENIGKTIQKASDHYDGALCFSQGSMAFQYILWYHALGYLNWPFIKNMKFFINFSADSFRISLKSLNFKRLSIPSLHFLSEEDFLFPRCIISPCLFEDPELIYHTFGHRFPILGVREKKQLRSFLKKHGFGEKVKGIEQQSQL